MVVLIKVGGMFLPPKPDITWEFIADVISGKRKLLKVSQIRSLEPPPRFNGISLDKIWRELKDNEKFKSISLLSMAVCLIEGTFTQ